MNKQSFESLKREEEIKEQIIDSWKYIKDLEAELEFLLTREPNESKYIVSIKDQIDKLYQQVEKLENEVMCFVVAMYSSNKDAKRYYNSII